MCAFANASSGPWTGHVRSTLGAVGGEVIERLVPVLGPTVLVDHQQRKWRLRPVGGHKEPGGVDVLFDAAGGQTRDQAVGAVREGGRAIFLVGVPAQLGRGVVGESLDADVSRQVLKAIGRLVEAARLRPQVEAVLPFEQVREALKRVAGGHTRGKIALQIGN